MPDSDSAILGSLLGIAIGDAMGLPFEGLSPQRQVKLAPKLDSHRFLFGYGMFSDDTDHACIVAQALIASGGDPEFFGSDLARRLRRWFLGLPAGVGFATLRSCLKLCVGFSHKHSGVFSAGNGPAMRAPLLGICFGDDYRLLKSFVRISTKLTHIDDKAEIGARSIALAAHMASREKYIVPRDFFLELERFLEDLPSEEFYKIVQVVLDSLDRGETTGELVLAQGWRKGVSGYMLHTVPVVLHCWLRNQNDYKNAIIEIIRCGGDTDTTAAILGGIVGASCCELNIPKPWVEKICDRPCTVKWIKQLAVQLAEARITGKRFNPTSLPWLKVFFRNQVFLFLVISHGFRRIFLW